MGSRPDSTAQRLSSHKLWKTAIEVCGAIFVEPFDDRCPREKWKCAYDEWEYYVLKVEESLSNLIRCVEDLEMTCELLKTEIGELTTLVDNAS